MPNFDDFKSAIEAMSGGKNTLLFNDRGMPSVMVPFPKMKISDIMADGSENIHPAFSVGGVEKDKIYVSKFQNIVIEDRAYSLPMRDPRAYVNFDQAVTYCRNNGKGWSLMPYALWAAIALWCRKNGTMPRGNNLYGCDCTHNHEKGVPCLIDSSNGKVCHCLTGSGPASWYHNWMPDGIADMNGNVWEWCAGMRLQNGEIQIVPYSNCMLAETGLGASSTAWKAIKVDGTLVEPGTSGTLKYDWVSGKIQLTSGNVTSTVNEYHGTPYNALDLAAGLTVPEIAKTLLFYPDEPDGDYAGDYHWMNPTGERLALCGGNWSSGAGAGVFGVSLSDPRAGVYSGVGFRSAYVDL